MEDNISPGVSILGIDPSPMGEEHFMNMRICIGHSDKPAEENIERGIRYIDLFSFSNDLGRSRKGTEIQIRYII